MTYLVVEFGVFFVGVVVAFMMMERQINERFKIVNGRDIDAASRLQRLEFSIKSIEAAERRRSCTHCYCAQATDMFGNTLDVQCCKCGLTTSPRRRPAPGTRPATRSRRRQGT